jgi:hypothetical protein
MSVSASGENEMEQLASVFSCMAVDYFIVFVLIDLFLVYLTTLSVTQTQHSESSLERTMKKEATV